MRHARPDRFDGSRGFTLIESIIVLVVLSIAAVAIMSMQGNIFYGQSGNKDLEVGVQLMQECAEQVLATRRQSGYSTSPDCSTSILPTFPGSGFGAPSVTVTSDASAVCPSGGTCKKVVISVSKVGANLTPVTLELVDY